MFVRDKTLNLLSRQPSMGQKEIRPGQIPSTQFFGVLSQSHAYYMDGEKQEKPNWPIVSDLFSQEIVGTKDWTTAELICDLPKMCEHFSQAYPGIFFSQDDMRLALHDMNIPYERNEHNNKFYYLANWR